ncbi:MAG TPA: twin-arginine translocase TatA/TatE family subunit [Thermoleophilaceae bacterium]|jgi:sec-independent protein translocase protein TatA
MPNIGPVEIIIVVVILLLVFGTRRLPEAGKNLGKGMREFKDSVTGKDEESQKELAASNTPQTSGQATAPPEQAAVQQPPPAPATAPAAPPEAEQAPEPEAARSGESRG